MPGTEVSRPESGTIDTTGGFNTLTIDLSAKLTITSVSGSKIIYNLTKKVQAASVVEGDKALDNMRFQKSQTGGGSTITMTVPEVDSWNIYAVSVEGTIQIPANVTVLKCSISSGSLDIDAGGTTFSDMELSLTSGQINAKNFSIANGGIFREDRNLRRYEHRCQYDRPEFHLFFHGNSGHVDINLASIDQGSVKGSVTSGSLKFTSSKITNSSINLEITEADP